MAIWLQGKGHEVRVVTAPPYYPEWKVDGNYTAWLYRRELFQGIDVWRCPLWIPSKPSSFKRLLHLISFAFTSFPVMLLQIKWRPDAIIVIEPPFFCAPQALLTARLSGSKAWLHIQDFEVEAFFGLGFSSLNFLKKWVVALENWLMRRFDHISSISSTMVNKISQKKAPQVKTSLFPNWVDTQYINPQSPVRDLRTEWGFTNDSKIILYAGNMGQKQGLEMVLDAAAMLESEHSDVSFLFIGEGAAKPSLIEKAKKMKLRNVFFKPVQPVQDLSALLAVADIHLVIQKRGVADAVMPSKLAAILASGGYAIITSDENTELGKMVLNNPGIATLIPPENTILLTEAIMELLSDPVIKRRGNVVARTYAERNLDTQVVLSNFTDILNNLK